MYISRVLVWWLCILQSGTIHQEKSLRQSLTMSGGELDIFYKSPITIVLLALALFVSAITLLPGRTNVLQGVVHLGLFIMFIVVAAVP